MANRVNRGFPILTKKKGGQRERRVGNQRRDARAADPARLESVCGPWVTVGSNPTPSATIFGSFPAGQFSTPLKTGI